jgi:hypothetical protein
MSTTFANWIVEDSLLACSYPYQAEQLQLLRYAVVYAEGGANTVLRSYRPPRSMF